MFMFARQLAEQMQNRRGSNTAHARCEGNLRFWRLKFYSLIVDPVAETTRIAQVSNEITVISPEVKCAQKAERALGGGATN